MLFSFIAHFVLSHAVNAITSVLRGSAGPSLLSSRSSSEKVLTQSVKVSTKSWSWILDFRAVLCWLGADMKPSSWRNIACRACTSARTSRAVLGASAIAERKPITLSPACSSPVTDAATEIPSIAEAREGAEGQLRVKMQS